LTKESQVQDLRFEVFTGNSVTWSSKVGPAEGWWYFNSLNLLVWIKSGQRS